MIVLGKKILCLEKNIQKKHEEKLVMQIKEFYPERKILCLENIIQKKHEEKLVTLLKANLHTTKVYQ